MKRIVFSVLFFACCLCSDTLCAQPTAGWPKTLLWRVSGNGLSKDSYLFGSLHLQDKRLFYFTDSLYHYLGQAEGYALEIDLREFMDSMIRKAINDKTEEWLDKKRLTHDGEKRKIVDSLLQNVREGNDPSSRRQLQELRDERLRKVMRKEMPTIMDAYLYGIAMRKGKWLGGIEDVSDQLSVFDELGREITAEELMTPDHMLTASLEDMIRLYLSADLDAIARYVAGSYSDELEDRMLRVRNIKMARRMDSLAHIRSMFFTVGAAHLPGDSGVISLLRQRGYRVDPVFSSARIDPDRYASALPAAAWVKVEDMAKTYEVEMPGPATDLAMFGDVLTMKYHTDITTFTYYMSGSMFAPINNLDNMLKALTENTPDGRVISQKKIEKTGLRGVEAVLSTGDVWYKVQYLLKDHTLYMLMAGGEKKESVETPDVRRFFASFVAGKPAAAPADTEGKAWIPFSPGAKACRVMLPGVPKRNLQVEQKAAEDGWQYTVYQYTDREMFYMLQVRDLAPGYHLSDGDSAYFDLCRQTYNTFISNATTDTLLTVQTFPAFLYEGEGENGELFYRALVVNRGNRIYVLLAGGENTADARVELDRYFNSFELTPYQTSSWRREWSPQGDFSVTAPAEVKPFISQDEEEEENANSTADTDSQTYVVYDSSRAVSYQLFKTVLSPYYWVSSDSLFFEQMGAQDIGWEDSVLYKKPSRNAGLKGIEWLIEMPGHNNRKRLRHFLNGDTLYTVIAFIPSQYTGEKGHDQFFDSFTPAGLNNSSTIFSSKAGRLLADLQSADTVLFTKALAALSTAPFGPEDRELLHQAILKVYIDDTLNAYYTTRQRLANALNELADSSTIDFVRKNLPLQTGSREMIKMDLLNVLARYKTAASYATLKQLLLTNTPAEKGNAELSYFITDSVELTRQLFPEILTLVDDDLFAERIIDIAAELLDSSLIDVDMLKPYRRNILYTADTTLRSLKGQVANEDYYGYNYSGMLHLLHYFNDAESNKLLQEYLLLDDLPIKYEAAMALLKNKQPVPA
ncbi:MAG: TraB/GumN family protein, partial [Chitinophagaceae bacterium]